MLLLVYLYYIIYIYIIKCHFKMTYRWIRFWDKRLSEVWCNLAQKTKTTNIDILPNKLVLFIINAYYRANNITPTAKIDFATWIIWLYIVVLWFFGHGGGIWARKRPPPAFLKYYRYSPLKVRHFPFSAVMVPSINSRYRGYCLLCPMDFVLLNCHFPFFPNCGIIKGK